MPPSPTLNIRIPPAVLEAIDAIADERGANRSQVALELLKEGLGMGEAVSQSVTQSETQQRLEAIEQRLSVLESSHKDKPVHTAVAQRVTVPQDRGGHPIADGVRWLTTTQAFQVAKARGFVDSMATFKRAAKSGGVDAYRLRHTPHGTKDNRLASFEDLGAAPVPYP